MLNKKKCLFIDHKYHAKTNSTKFLIDALLVGYEVEILFLDDFSTKSLENILKKDVDFFLVFQYDFIAPFLLSNNKKVLIVPMYDGTGEMPPVHWLSMRGGLFLNFSSFLHKIHLGIDLNSIYCQYYPNPDNYPKFDITKNEPDSLFFWERQPQTGISIDWLAHQINKSPYTPKTIHIHQSADPGQYTTRHPSLVGEIFPGRLVMTSSWFSSKSILLECLTKSGIYLAPRKAEGIGFSFLDAIACGLVVCVHDKPTMNEYIVDGKNGLIFYEDLPDFRTIDLESIRARSLESCRLGHANWCTFVPVLLAAIDKHLLTPSPKILKPISPAHANQIIESFFTDQSVYRSYLYELVTQTGSATIWKSRFPKESVLTRFARKLSDSPVVHQITLVLYSKRKKFL